MHRPRRLLLLFLLAVAAAAVAAVGAVGWIRHQAGVEREDGLRIAQSGRFDDAEPLLRRAWLRNADDLDVVKALARGFIGTGRVTEAEACLDRWCALRPDEAEPFKRRMELRHGRARAAPNAAEQQRLMLEAVADGQEALLLDPDDQAVAQDAVWLLLQVGRFDEADKVYRKCLGRQPDDPWLTYLSARICYGREDADRAAVLLDALLERAPRFTPALLLRGVLYNEAGESARAVHLLRQVLALDRDPPKEARYQLSLALERTGQAEEARQVMAELQKANLDWLLAGPHDPDAPGIRLQRAECYLAGGREEEALRLLAPLLNDASARAAAHTLLAAYYERQGQTERAAEHRRLAGN
jgi:tetratricopeptide (TPR) repeat protein